MRDGKMDYLKGMLVLGMVWCHVCQFFVFLDASPLSRMVIQYANAVTFSGFVFSFGYVSGLAYYSKAWAAVWPKMLRTALRLLGAFYVSGLAFRVFVDNKVVSKNLMLPILTLRDIPGWSEFIVSFSLIMLIGILLFVPFKWLMAHSRWHLGILLLLLGTTYIPYGGVKSSWLGLLVGTTRFAAFPVIQYMPYYLLGLYFYKQALGFDKKILIGTGIGSLSGVGWILYHQGNLPSRFPPSIFWLVLPASVIYLLYLFSGYLAAYPEKNRFLAMIGRQSMAYLLLSNLIIFSMAGTKALLPLKDLGGVLVTLLIMVAIGLVLGFGGSLPYKVTTSNREASPLKNHGLKTESMV